MSLERTSRFSITEVFAIERNITSSDSQMPTQGWGQAWDKVFTGLWCNEKNKDKCDEVSLKVSFFKLKDCSLFDTRSSYLEVSSFPSLMKCWL